MHQYRKEVSDYINNHHEYKMEIGADVSPLCNEKNTIFVDDNCYNLLRTYASMNNNTNIMNTEYLLADAESIPIMSSSMDCVVSAYFPWSANTKEETFIKFLTILSEWKRVIRKDGTIIIMTHISLIRTILQVSSVIKLKPIKRFKNNNDRTIVFKVS